MKSMRSFFGRGWRRTGLINVILVSLFGLFVLVSLLLSIAHNKTSLKLNSTKIYEGRCTVTSKLSTILHIFINIVSTGILASSNFFMQITTSPTRKEVDRAHMVLRPLDIGLPSWRNLASLSYFKRICWFILLLSSIPIHLFFNSAIYNTAFQGNNFNLTIATSAFTQNQPYWVPGASLTPSGASSPVQKNNLYIRQLSPSLYQNPSGLRIYNDSETTYQDFTDDFIQGYGDGIPLDDYWNKTSEIPQRIDDAAREGSKWDHLDVDECLKEYQPEGYRTSYTDLIIIVASGTNDPKGWLRNQVYEFTNNSLYRLWDRIPSYQVNSLWSWAHCSYSKDHSHNCGTILSQPISFANDNQPGNSTAANETQYGYRARQRVVDIQGCLAKPVETCQVLVSNSLLLAVFICVVIKIAVCSTILWHEQDVSLITPGDAIDSFITSPDKYTHALATFNVEDSQRLECSPRHMLVAAENTCSFSSIRPRRWDGTRYLLRSSILQETWLQVYYPTTAALVGLFIAWVLTQTLGQRSLKDFGQTENLILSFVYLIINMLHTQLQVENEWNLYGLSYKPLRVSYPEGQQTSTYRLQLPYKYSIPLMGTSTALHWLVSNSLFIVIINGRSDIITYDESLLNDFGLSEGTFVAAGYSDLSILILLICGTVFVTSPLWFKGIKLKSDMVFGGTNSLVLSAACHVPKVPRHPEEARPIATPTPIQDEQLLGNGMSTVELPLVESVPVQPNKAFVEVDREYLVAVSRRPLRWGVTSLPDDLVRDVSVDDDEPVMHLSFGTEDHDVQEPQVGALYA
ncbi:hypothetical protein PG984_005486 [Apiospora sp. TS-2023a]